MKMKLTEFFVKRPVLFWSFMAAILIAGVLSFIQMPKLEDPAVSAKQAMVVVAYPGASAHEVECDEHGKGNGRHGPKKDLKVFLLHSLDFDGANIRTIIRNSNNDGERILCSRSTR